MSMRERERERERERKREREREREREITLLADTKSIIKTCGAQVSTSPQNIAAITSHIVL